MGPIFCDLDEVLFDFSSPACEIHGWSRDEVGRRCTPGDGHWSIQSIMEIDSSDFWKPIHELGESFWTDRVKPLPWAQDVVRMLHSYAPNNWFVITSPVACKDCPIDVSVYTGKSKLLYSYFDREITRCLITPHKEHFARIPGAILIDDNPKNVDLFAEYGGHAILFPCWSNRLSSYTDDPVVYLVNELEKLCT